MAEDEKRKRWAPKRKPEESSEPAKKSTKLHEGGKAQASKQHKARRLYMDK